MANYKYIKRSIQYNYVKYFDEKPKLYVISAIHKHWCNIMKDVMNKCNCDPEIEKGIPDWDLRENNCKHEHKVYQAAEKRFNVPESYVCYECDYEFDIPEPDWDLMGKYRHIDT